MTATAPRAVGTTAGPPQRPLLARLSAVAAVVFAALLGVLGTATEAAAHAALTGSDPAQGAVVASAPDTVTLTFSEQVAMNDDSIRVLDPDGERVDTGELQDLCSESVIRWGVGLRSGVADGTYTVAWQAVSADSHPVSGAFTFSIGAPSETSVELPEQQAGGGPVGGLYDAARYFAYGGFLLLVGGCAFVLAVWREGAGSAVLRRLVVGGWLTLVVSTLLALLLRHPYTTGGGVPDAFDLSGLAAVVETGTGTALVSRLLLCAVAALFVAVLFGSYRSGARERGERQQRDLHLGLVLGGSVLTLGVAATWAMAEHASTGPQPQVAVPVSIVHLLAMAVWLGGLAALLSVLYRGEVPVPRAAVRRFSAVAFGAVVVLAATGLYQSWRQLGSWSALTGTEYGRLLLAKLALLGVLLVAARYSRRWVAALAKVPGDATDGRSGPSGPSAGAVSEANSAAEQGGSAETDPRPDAEAADDGRKRDDDGRERGSGEDHGRSDAGGGGGDRDRPAADPVPTEGPVPAADPVRAAQLARQAAAVEQARRRKERDADPERAGLRRGVLVEAAVAAVLLAVTTVLTGTEPGRTAEAAARAGDTSTAVPDRPVELSVPFDTGGEDGEGTALVELDPGRTGDNVLHVRTDVDAEEVRVSLTLAKEEIGPLQFSPEPVEGSERHWSSEGVQLPRPGEWELAVTVRTSDIDQITETRTVKIG
ncbi:copper resistance protein CopC [Streptomyces sp. XM4193]|uniref:copper resistance CopC/CopD family protein n=1 Tax=Streptomyces sp. XM4193 TaxID=2929782 RepID=UPI001FFA1522|nr:copper resistance protein CopC [Streptomyces sp. XM4193]MCK1794705.1 copper resistance protein CopC [Streptomyces sp. XM4193]